MADEPTDIAQTAQALNQPEGNSWLNSLLSLFRSAPAPTKVTYHAASQPKAYPTSEDAEFARQQDYSYGQPWAPEFNNQSNRVLVGDPNARDLDAVTISGERTPPNIKQHMANVNARAALAMQNSALATLGYDPNRIAYDVTRDPEKVNILGTYRRATDQIYANARDPSAVIHESIHRGLQKLRETEFWKKEFERFNGRGEEDLVRYLMHSRMGNPEEGSEENVDRRQVRAAKHSFESGPISGDLQRLLKEVEWAAAQYLAKKRPMGPR